ncbi:hypothetical protein [Rhizobium sp. AN95]|uniref:hypothetical protein n=1 Tax=Rhizobium sp. AN95 TaxID=3035216 RepID=UPI002B261DF1|nr:hypothetical protein [Rhizobium sp. AN95]
MGKLLKTTKLPPKQRALDNVVLLEGLQNAGLTYSDIVKASRIATRRNKLLGRAANVSTLWRIKNKGRRVDDIAGLTESAIQAFFGTQSRVAYRAQLAEHALRAAKHEELPVILESVRSVLADLTGEKHDELEVSDRFAVASLDAQIDLYSVRFAQPGPESYGLYVSALAKLMPHQPEIERLMTGNLVAEDPGLAVLSVRMMLNALFASYEMDAGGPLVTTRAKSNKFMSADFVKNTEKVTMKFGDARLGFYAAEAAAFLGRRYVAERLIRISMKADGYDGPFALWKPGWHPRRPSEEPHLADVLPLLV